VYILLCDETNTQPSETVKFFVYGGLFFPIDKLTILHEKIGLIRKDAGYKQGDKLKFDTQSRPSYVEIEKATEAKRRVVNLCIDCGCKFIVHIILHDIIKNQRPEEKVQRAANYVIGRYNLFLKSVKDYGICIVDNFPCKGEFEYLSQKFSYGLDVKGQTKELDRILLFASTCVGASHANSAMDIVLGSFRYCINAPEKPASTEMLPSIAKMMWHKYANGRLKLIDYGLILRPKIDDIRSPAYRKEYSQLIENVEALFRKPYFASRSWCASH